jgi:hypothetical protein
MHSATALRALAPARSSHRSSCVSSREPSTSSPAASCCIWSSRSSSSVSRHGATKAHARASCRQRCSSCLRSPAGSSRRCSSAHTRRRGGLCGPQGDAPEGWGGATAVPFKPPVPQRGRLPLDQRRVVSRPLSQPQPSAPRPAASKPPAASTPGRQRAERAAPHHAAATPRALLHCQTSPTFLVSSDAPLTLLPRRSPVLNPGGRDGTGRPVTLEGDRGGLE